MTMDLPQGITLGQLSRAFNLSIPADFDLLWEKVSELDIHILHLDVKQYILPFPGCEVHIFPVDHNLTLQITSLNNNPFCQEQPVRLEFRKPALPWLEFSANVENWLERQQVRVLTACDQCFHWLTQNLSNQHDYSIVDKLKTILGYDVFLLDSQLDVLTWSGGKQLPENPIPFFPPKMPTKASVAPSPGFTETFKGFWKDSRSDLSLTWYPLSSQQGILGYLGLSVGPECFGSIEHYFLDKASALLSFELLKNQSICENERQHHRDFLFDLLYNNFESLEVICSRGKLWGWDFSRPHLVAVGEIQDFAPLPVERQRLDNLITKATRTLRNLDPATICLERSDQIVFLFPLREMTAQSQTANTAELLLQPFWNLAATLFPDRKIFFGLGSLYPTAREIHRSFQEARSALEIGRLLYPDKRLTAFNDLGIMRLLQKLDHQELEDFRLETLKPLLDFDRDGNLELEQTLLTYYLCNGDLNQAAQKLFLHPNTLRYRIKKASEVLDRDVSHLNQQLNLFVALQIGRLKNLWS
ncbi:helix-turn-helix domain-containing protein [Desulfosporosinus sp. PR]|uniref:PucR family transcriptional regulator n=1 Tax=Candidatus Desulfosporosinus nitrosoreducens TaxID=3401928 RepID=UPI0027F45660|nr:helix-turn-helix domain-containing protein [Desulfosporosinus sp. PR]MDQ7094063.1 helix-turn-helix domain-containing protein [Desulfosporosinus sp. PR]